LSKASIEQNNEIQGMQAQLAGLSAIQEEFTKQQREMTEKFETMNKQLQECKNRVDALKAEAEQLAREKLKPAEAIKPKEAEKPVEKVIPAAADIELRKAQESVSKQQKLVATYCQEANASCALIFNTWDAKSNDIEKLKTQAQEALSKAATSDQRDGVLNKYTEEVKRLVGFVALTTNFTTARDQLRDAKTANNVLVSQYKEGALAQQIEASSKAVASAQKTFSEKEEIYNTIDRKVKQFDAELVQFSIAENTSREALMMALGELVSNVTYLPNRATLTKDFSELNQTQTWSQFITGRREFANLHNEAIAASSRNQKGLVPAGAIWGWVGYKYMDELGADGPSLTKAVFNDNIKELQASQKPLGELDEKQFIGGLQKTLKALTEAQYLYDSQYASADLIKYPLASRAVTLMKMRQLIKAAQQLPDAKINDLWKLLPENCVNRETGAISTTEMNRIFRDDQVRTTWKGIDDFFTKNKLWEALPVGYKDELEKYINARFPE